MRAFYFSILVPIQPTMAMADQSERAEHLYIPTFAIVGSNHTTNLTELSNKWRGKSWLTDGLENEIANHTPYETEINRKASNQRDTDAFKSKVGAFSLTGRVFASYRQLTQAAELLLEQWAIKPVHRSKATHCWYSSSWIRNPGLP
jgi:hypothetical protein